MIYCFDIDGTICTDTKGDYPQAQPIPTVIARIGRLHAEGHEIILHTARGTLTGIDWWELTDRQLHDWGVSYHKLILGKPAADVYIDDKGVNVADWRRSGFQDTSACSSGNYTKEVVDRE